MTATRTRWTLAAVSVILASLGEMNVDQAAMLAYEFAGVVNRVADPSNLLASTVATGDTFSGYFSFDPETTDLHPGDPSWGEYTSPSFSLMCSLGPHAMFSGYGNGRVYVGNSSYGDQLVIAAGVFHLDQHVWVSAINAWVAERMGDLLPDDSLPLEALAIPPGTTRAFFVKGFGDMGGDGFTVDGELSSFSVVPEPSAVTLLMPALFLLRKRAHRQR